MLPKPFSSSTPLKTDEIIKIYDEEKEKYLQTAITINETDLEAAVENAEKSNKEVIDDIISPTPGLIVDKTLNLDKQFEYTSNDLERNFELTNQLQNRLDNLLLKMKENTQPSIDSNLKEKPTMELPNKPLISEKCDIKSEDIYIDDNYFDNIQFFPKPSTDDRKDFEMTVGRDEIFIFKSATLTAVNISRRNLKDALNNILKDLNTNIEDFQTHIKRKTDRKRIEKITKFINKIDSEEKQHIENKINANSWIKKLIDDQLKTKENYFTFGENFQEFEPIGNTPKDEKIRKNPYDNVTTRKRKRLLITSERRVKELPSLYTEISTDQTKKITLLKKCLIKLLNKYHQPPKSDLKFITTKKIILHLMKNECR